MSLNFNFSKTAYLEEVGSIWQRNEDGTNSGYLLPELDSIVWNAAMVGMPSITAANVERFINRVQLWESVFGPTCTRWNGDDRRVTAFDPDVVRKCVGFGCNVTPQSKAVFLKRLTDNKPL